MGHCFAFIILLFENKKEKRTIVFCLLFCLISFHICCRSSSSIHVKTDPLQIVRLRFCSFSFHSLAIFLFHFRSVYLDFFMLFGKLIRSSYCCRPAAFSDYEILFQWVQPFLKVGSKCEWFIPFIMMVALAVFSSFAAFFLLWQLEEWCWWVIVTQYGILQEWIYDKELHSMTVHAIKGGFQCFRIALFSPLNFNEVKRRTRTHCTKHKYFSFVWTYIEILLVGSFSITTLFIPFLYLLTFISYRISVIQFNWWACLLWNFAQ